jgi:transposase
MKSTRCPRAIVAVAPNIAVVLHRMWVDGSDFRLGSQQWRHDLTAQPPHL